MYQYPLMKLFQLLSDEHIMSMIMVLKYYKQTDGGMKYNEGT